MYGEIKKGPWKADEDEVLIKHVQKHGPRDWSSIRSKGLLHRTGKSCRLRWVNKLRSNLKNGVKFSAEEERVVMELQAEFGNKWARIATYLPGRTDNDVKNFWSSRQKRLARVLHISTPPPPPKTQKSLWETPSLHKVPFFEAPKCDSSTDGESSPKTLSGSSSYCEPIKMVPLPQLMNPAVSLNFGQNHHPLCQLDYTTIPLAENGHPLLEDFPHVPPLHIDMPPPPPPLESHDIFSQLGDPNFFAVFGHGGSSDMFHFPYVPPGERQENDDQLMMGPDTFIDEFPMDLFDQIPSDCS